VPEELVVAVVLDGTVDTVTPPMSDPLLLSVTVPLMVEFGGAALTVATENESSSTGVPEAANPYRPISPAVVIVLLVPDHVHAEGSVDPAAQTLR